MKKVTITIHRSRSTDQDPLIRDLLELVLRLREAVNLNADETDSELSGLKDRVKSLEEA